MDVYSYIPDVISYSSMRHSFTTTQPNAWSMETTKDTRKKNAVEKKVSASCQDCPICQERRRRPLATYIRSKSRQDRCATTSISEDSEDIVEEDEEDVEESPKTQTKPVLTQQANK